MQALPMTNMRGPVRGSRCLPAVGGLLVGWLLIVGSVQAGEFNEVLSIGDPLPAWKDLPGTDGKRHSLTDLKDKSVVVVIFTCVSCPTATDYEARINALVEAHGGPDGKVAVVPVCVNRVEADSLPALTKRVASQSLKFHYLYDESQAVAKAFGAIFTPEFYVFDAERKLVYMGAMDDSTDPANVTKKYVQAAVAAALRSEKPAVTETIARGCRVRYVRPRGG